MSENNNIEYAPSFFNEMMGKEYAPPFWRNILPSRWWVFYLWIYNLVVKLVDVGIPGKEIST